MLIHKGKRLSAKGTELHNHLDIDSIKLGEFNEDVRKIFQKHSSQMTGEINTRIRWEINFFIPNDYIKEARKKGY